MTAEVLVEAIDVSTQAVLSSGRFAGEYELTVPSQREITVRVTAEMLRETPRPMPHWHVKIWDLDDFGSPLGPIHSYTSPDSTAVREASITSTFRPAGVEAASSSVRVTRRLCDTRGHRTGNQTVFDVDPTVTPSLS